MTPCVSGLLISRGHVSHEWREPCLGPGHYEYHREARTGVSSYDLLRRIYQTGVGDRAVVRGGVRAGVGGGVRGVGVRRMGGSQLIHSQSGTTRISFYIRLTFP